MEHAVRHGIARMCRANRLAIPIIVCSLFKHMNRV
jgi:hypothetical protein